MPVVSDTSPILNLAIIRRLSLLWEQFGEVWIPPAVLKELRVEESLPGNDLIREALETGWLKTETVMNSSLVQALRRELDKGEAEAIALALQMNAECILLDERDARRVARSFGLKVTGVLGVLLRAKKEGKLSELRREMEELRREAGFFIGMELYVELLRESGEI